MFSLQESPYQSFFYDIQPRHRDGYNLAKGEEYLIKIEGVFAKHHTKSTYSKPVDMQESDYLRRYRKYALFDLMEKIQFLQYLVHLRPCSYTGSSVSQYVFFVPEQGSYE